ncbi:MAG TPA: hypothetical protein VFN67_06385 [Polyangiales bacterium]|nr:hypothetical protein [Polyangiales bacterium]
MPSHLLIDPRQHLAAQARVKRKSLSLGALFVVLAACGSEAAAPGDDANATKSATTATAGAAATPPTAASNAPKTTSGQTQSTPSGMSSSGTPSAGAMVSPASNAPSSAMPAMNTPAQTTPNMAMGAMPMTMKDPMTVDMKDPMTPASSDPVKLPDDVGTPTLFWLDIASGVVTKAGADGAGAMRVASGSPLSAPDGVTIDPESKKFWVLNMGSVIGGGNGGSLVRYDLDGKNPEVIMKPGSMGGGETFNTGKQVTIDRVNKKLYMGDREGSKVWRCDYDGKNLEPLVSGHGVMQIVGVGADPTKRQFYFSDRNGLKLFRASMDMPAGKTHADRDDVEMIYQEKAASAMPLDIELDLEKRQIYWTDRNQGKIFGMGMDFPAGENAMNRTDVKTISSGLTQAIGLAFDHKEGILYVTHAGTVSMVKTDGTGLKAIGSSGSTGIAFARVP